MGIFEQYPILVVVLIVGTVEAWEGVKRIVRKNIKERRVVK
jgi:hypothetical protein